MSFSDFLRQFSRLEICSLSPDSLSSEEVQKWSLVLFNGRRTRGGPAGGGRNHPGEGTGCPGRLPRLVLPEPGVLAGSFPSSVLWLPGTTRGPAPPLGHGDQGSEVGGQALQPLVWGPIGRNTVLQLLCVQTVLASPACPWPRGARFSLVPTFLAPCTKASCSRPADGRPSG